jgi:hypothetical protein
VIQRQADGAGVSVLSGDAVENIRQLRGFAIPWEQVAAAVGASEADCRAALGLPMPEPPDERARLPWDRQGNLFEQ